MFLYINMILMYNAEVTFNFKYLYSVSKWDMRTFDIKAKTFSRYKTHIKRLHHIFFFYYSIVCVYYDIHDIFRRDIL